MLVLDNERKMLDLFKAADDARLTAANPFNVLLGGVVEVQTAYDKFKREILDAGLWFEFMYYVNGGKLFINPDVDLGDGIRFVVDRYTFYLNDQYVDADKVYEILSENGKLDVYAVADKIAVLDGVSMTAKDAIMDALNIGQRGEWR